MIKGLFETHINVKSLEVSMAFYEKTLGLLPGSVDNERRVAFYWMGSWGEAMLGLWEKPAAQIVQQHFAFRCETSDILKRSENFLKERNLHPYNFLKDGSQQPMVFAWMPALAIYFRDPDDHILEFISMLPGTPTPAMGIISYETWMEKIKTEAAPPGE